MDFTRDQPPVVISDRRPRIEDGPGPFAKRGKPATIPLDLPAMEGLDERFVVVVVGGRHAPTQETACLGEEVVHCGSAAMKCDQSCALCSCTKS